MSNVILLPRQRTLNFSAPLVMGIINCTPDSFSDAGQALKLADAMVIAESMIEGGADILDIGGESTRPDASPVSFEEERKRVMPLIEALRARFSDFPLSLDTQKPELMQLGLSAGIDIVNDIGSFQDPQALEALLESEASAILMHKRGTPQTMQTLKNYDQVHLEVFSFLQARIHQLCAAGIAPERLIIDPGFGFAKGLDENLTLLRHLDSLQALGLPILVGLSRKASIGQLTGQKNPSDRMVGSLSAHLIAHLNGANIIRTHDVQASREMLAVATAYLSLEKEGVL